MNKQKTRKTLIWNVYTVVFCPCPKVCMWKAPSSVRRRKERTLMFTSVALTKGSVTLRTCMVALTTSPSSLWPRNTAGRRRSFESVCLEASLCLWVGRLTLNFPLFLMIHWLVLLIVCVTRGHKAWGIGFKQERLYRSM